MRTNSEIDASLMAEAMEVAGAKTKKAAVETALREPVENHRRRDAIDDLTGLGWDGDLDAMREGRTFDESK